MATPRETGLEHRATAASGDSSAGHNTGAELAPGTVVAGRYRVLRLLGRGGMGAVYEAFEEAIERRVALKLLHPIIALEPQVAARFLEEAKLANRVRHPAVVEVTDFGTHDGRPFLVMELLDGESLGARLERGGPFAPAAAVALLEPVFAALSHLHERGVVHRDLKPDNIFLARVGPSVTPRVLDLGIAKARTEGQSLTATDAMLGTPAYMAPEQVRSSRSVTALADQYALGCVVYEMLTGRMPIEADNLHGILVAKVTEDPVSILHWAPTLPAALAAVVMRSLARDPAQRFPDLAAFHAALVAALDPRAPPLDLSPPVVTVPDTAAPAPTEVASEGAPPAARRRARALVVVSAAAVAAALVAAVELASRPTPAVVSAPAAGVRPPTAPPAAPPPSPPAPPVAPPPPAAPPVAPAVVAAPEAPAAPDAGARVRRGGHRRAPGAPDGRLDIDGRNPLRGASR